jgi:hypothetical protein
LPAITIASQRDPHLPLSHRHGVGDDRQAHGEYPPVAMPQTMRAVNGTS